MIVHGLKRVLRFEAFKTISFISRINYWGVKVLRELNKGDFNFNLDAGFTVKNNPGSMSAWPSAGYPEEI